LKKASEIFRRLILLFDDDEFTDSVGVRHFHPLSLSRFSKRRSSFQAKGLPEDKTSSQMYTLCIDICNVLIEYKFLRLKDA